jgi:hypothetical protein
VEELIIENDTPMTPEQIRLYEALFNDCLSD